MLSIAFFFVFVFELNLTLGVETTIKGLSAQLETNFIFQVLLRDFKPNKSR